MAEIISQVMPKMSHLILWNCIIWNYNLQFCFKHEIRIINDLVFAFLHVFYIYKDFFFFNLNNELICLYFIKMKIKFHLRKNKIELHLAVGRSIISNKFEIGIILLMRFFKLNNFNSNRWNHSRSCRKIQYSFLLTVRNILIQCYIQNLRNK